MKEYRHVFFDLDHTLWDFETNSRHTLSDIHSRIRLAEDYQVSLDDFLNAFRSVNKNLWNKYNLNLLGRDQIRNTRFSRIFQMLKIDYQGDPLEVSDYYIQTCPTKGAVMPYCHELLHELKDHFDLHIITNGFDDVQQIKLEKSGLRDFFIEVITSENSKSRKPDRAIFEYAIQVTNADPAVSVLIGDNPETDIKGALEFGMDTIFYNPLGLPHKYSATYEVEHLEEVEKILLPHKK